MKEFKIVYTEPSDREIIHWLFEEAIAYQKRKGYVVWQGYDKAQLKREMEQKQQYKITIDGELACIFSVFYSDRILWDERENGLSIYLHRIVVNPNHKGKKLFGKVLEWAIQNALDNGLEYVRMDTWADNPNIINYYKNYGFKFIEDKITPDSVELPPHYRKQPIALLELNIAEHLKIDTLQKKESLLSTGQN